MRVATRWAGGALLALLIVPTLAACRSSSSVGGVPAGARRSTSPASSTATPGGGSSASAAGSGDTHFVRFRAFTTDGRVTTAVRQAGSGSCFTTSITVPVPRAYRCFERNRILDPCFASPAQAQPDAVVCYADPWSPGARVTLTKPLPDSSPIGHGRPWALLLANGARCLSVTGTVQIDDGVALAYQCPRGYAAGLRSEHGRLLVAAYGVPPDGSLRRTTVTTAWTG
jgi:hypothetical protein